MMGSLAFSSTSKQRIAELVARYPRKQAALIPTLYVAQDQFGHLSDAVMQLVADELELPLASVFATAMFYTMLRKKPVGTWHLQICANVSCGLRGSDHLVGLVQDVLGIGPGETTADGLFTLEIVQCLAACGYAPALQVNKKDYFNVTPDGLKALIEELRTQRTEKSPETEAAHA
jgi:NADH-quinone oxidoreductase E subunit